MPDQKQPSQGLFQRLMRSRPVVAVKRSIERLDTAFDRQSARLETVVAQAWRRGAAWTSPRYARARDAGARGGRWLADRSMPVFQTVAQRVPRHIALGLMTLVVALIAWRLWWVAPMTWVAEWIHEPIFLKALEDRQLLTWLTTVRSLAGVVAAFAGITAVLAIAWRSRVSAWCLKGVAASSALLWMLAARLASAIPTALHAAPSDHYTTGMRNAAWTASWGYLIPGALVVAVYIVMVSTGATRRRYGGSTTGTWADRLLVNLRTHGEDPPFRRAQYQSLAWHIFIIFILPFLLFWFRLMESPYEVPKGSGEPVLEMVRIRQVEKKPRERYFLNPDSAISFYVPEIEDSEVFEQVDEMTKNLYEATQIGALGDGGGTTGGWPDGMENARVRFIRLEYDGVDWDHNMGFGYDYNLLLQFRRLTGFDIWPQTESIRISRLLHFPRGRAPPFVYLTGFRGRMNISESEVRALRRYCLELGGMIFADNAGGHFNQDFRALLRRAFPELPLVEIANDDIIFRQPYVFPQGAPPLWHHSGMRAMGMKHGGRWIVFYHQGELSDAWRDGHSGISTGLAMQAYKMGINVVYYAFTQYMRLNHPRRR